MTLPSHLRRSIVQLLSNIDLSLHVPLQVKVISFLKKKIPDEKSNNRGNLAQNEGD